MSHYTQFTQEERYQIYVLKKTGHSLVSIAEALWRHKSTISRDTTRDSGLRGYRPKQAHEFAVNRRQNKSRHRINTEALELMAEKMGLSISGLIRTNLEPLTDGTGSQSMMTS